MNSRAWLPFASRSERLFNWSRQYNHTVLKRYVALAGIRPRRRTIDVTG
jgi:hypothetical protein